MKHFSKYHGAGNDFIMIARNEWVYFDEELTPKICDRRTGVGADGVIIIEPSENQDFEVNYLNADGSKSFCGNGARCSMAFALDKNLIDKNKAEFLAIDGVHRGEILPDGNVLVSMEDVNSIHSMDNHEYLCDTGSPHYVLTQQDENIDVLKDGQKIRFSEQFKEEGVNVNWVIEKNKDEFDILTYERGVEAETLACGTGAVAAALVLHQERRIASPVKLSAKGGLLKVHFENNGQTYHDIFLEGPAQKVYEGKWSGGA